MSDNFIYDIVIRCFFFFSPKPKSKISYKHFEIPVVIVNSKQLKRSSARHKLKLYYAKVRIIKRSSKSANNFSLMTGGEGFGH